MFSLFNGGIYKSLSGSSEPLANLARPPMANSCVCSVPK